MPMERIRYPTDWREIATVVKTAAGWKCEQCAETRRKRGRGRPMENGEFQACDIEAGVWVDITESLTYMGRTDGENETAYSYQGRALRAGNEDAALFQITVFLTEPVDADMSDEGVYLPILTKIGILRRRADA